MSETKRFVFPINDLKLTMLILQNVSQQLNDFCADYNIQDASAKKKISDLKSLVDYSSKVIEPSYKTFFDFLTEINKKDAPGMLLDVSKIGSSYYVGIEYEADYDDEEEDDEDEEDNDDYSFGDLLSSILEKDDEDSDEQDPF